MVPRINLLRSEERRPGARALFVAGLMVVLLIEVFFIQFLSRGLFSAWAVAAESRRALAVLERELAVEESKLAPLYDQLAVLERPDSDAGVIDQKVIADRIDWSTPLSALFGAGGPTVRLRSVVTRQDGVMEVRGTAADVVAMSTFQAAIQSVSDILELRSLSWEESGPSLDFTAVLDVR